MALTTALANANSYALTSTSLSYAHVWSPSWRWGHGVWGVLSYMRSSGPAGGATIDICSVSLFGFVFLASLPSLQAALIELKPTIDLGSILRDLGDLHAMWSLLFLLPNLRWFYGFSPSNTFLLLLLVSWLLSVNVPLLSSSTLAFSSHVCLYLEPQP